MFKFLKSFLLFVCILKILIYLNYKNSYMLFDFLFNMRLLFSYLFLYFFFPHFRLFIWFKFPCNILLFSPD